MVMRIYVLLLILIIVVFGIEWILEDAKQKILQKFLEQEKKYIKTIDEICEKLEKIWTILVKVFAVLNVIVVFLRVSILVKIMAISFLILLAIYIIAYKVEKKAAILESIFDKAVFICMLFYVLISLFTCLSEAINETVIDRSAEHVESIQILEMKEIPYTNVSGSVYYIRSAPDLVYYYKVETPGGGTITKAINGYDNYVEVLPTESREQPHIEVFRESETRQNGYEIKHKVYTRYLYYIYTPNGETYFEK